MILKDEVWGIKAKGFPDGLGFVYFRAVVPKEMLPGDISEYREKRYVFL